MTDRDLQMVAKLKADGFDVDTLVTHRDASNGERIDEISQSDLSDQEWESLSALIPAKFMSRPRANERYRKLFNALMWLKQSRTPETCLPERYDTNASIRKLREAMALRGDFASILAALPTLGLEPARAALQARICDEGRRRGDHILSMRRRGAASLLQ